MAHANTLRTPTGFHREPLDGSRIAAGTGTIIVNVALVLALLVPLSQQATHVPDNRDEAIQIVELRTIKPVEAPPEEVKVVAQRPVPTTRPTVSPQPIPPVDTVALVDSQPGDIAISPAEISIDAGLPSLEPTPPSAGAQLQTLMAPPPAYPGDAVREGLSGTVELEILVGIDGRPLQARVVRSSGHRVLDQAARRTVLTRWVFQPAMREGQPVQALGRVPIEFKLDR